MGFDDNIKKNDLLKNDEIEKANSGGILFSKGLGNSYSEVKRENQLHIEKEIFPEDLPHEFFIDSLLINEEEEIVKKPEFDPNLVLSYPNANKKISLSVWRYGLKEYEEEEKSQQTVFNSYSQHISPHGVEFRTATPYDHGDLLKIHVKLPNYWAKKQKLVDYCRVDTPDTFSLLARVVSRELAGKRGKKYLVMARTLVIDKIDEDVLTSYLQD